MKQDHRETALLIELTIPGHCVGKKNRVIRTARGVFYDKATRERLDEIEASVREQWGDRKPLLHPAIGVYFSMASERSDRDNSLTTILDALVKCGVLEDDCIAKSNGTYIITPGVVDKEAPFTLVWLQPDGDVAPLVAKLEQLAAVAQMPRTMMLKRRSRWRR